MKVVSSKNNYIKVDITTVLVLVANERKAKKKEEERNSKRGKNEVFVHFIGNFIVIIISK